MQENKLTGLINAFEPGDLLFGLEKEARVRFHQELKNKLIKLGAKYDFVTIDEMIKPLESYYLYGNTDDPDPLEQQPSPVKRHCRLWASSPEYDAINQQPSSPDTKEHRKILLSDQIAIEHAAGKIHFCLDGIDLIKYPDSYTSHELIYIATHFGTLSHKVIFYKKGEPVSAPWDELSQSPEEWLQMHNKNFRPAKVCVKTHKTLPVKLVFY